MTDFEPPIELVKAKYNLKTKESKANKKNENITTKDSLKNYAINYAKRFDQVKIF